MLNQTMTEKAGTFLDPCEATLNNNKEIIPRFLSTLQMFLKPHLWFLSLTRIS